jgi:hypothetical protein
MKMAARSHSGIPQPQDSWFYPAADGPCRRCGDPDCLLADCESTSSRFCHCGKPRLLKRIKCFDCEAKRLAEAERRPPMRAKTATDDGREQGEAMPIMVNAGSGRSFKPAPEGISDGVCVDVVDMGLIETTWNGKTRKAHKVRLVWEIRETFKDEETGKTMRFIVQRRYTASLHDKAGLRKDLKSWRGKDFTPEDLRGFDLEKIIGAPCKLVIEHAERDGETYANVAHITKADKNSVLQPSGDYIRVKDRPPKDGNGTSTQSDAAEPTDAELDALFDQQQGLDSDLPF